MNRIEVEAKLGRDRAKLIELFESLSDADLTRDATPSEHDSSSAWNAKDDDAFSVAQAEFADTFV